MKQIEFDKVLATILVRNIAEIETQFHDEIKELYARLPETTFKELRRALPIIRSKLDWSNIFAYKIGSEIAKE